MAKETRQRMTAQSKADTEAAVRAQLIPENGGGYSILLFGSNPDAGAVSVTKGSGENIIYSSMANAKRAVKVHNSQLNPTLKPSI
jgi:hypothetical protein